MPQAVKHLAKVPCPGCGVSSLERYKTAAIKTKGVIRRRIWRCRGCQMTVLTEERIVAVTKKSYVPVPEKEPPPPLAATGAVKPEGR